MGIIEAAKLAFEYKKYDENGEVEETIRAVDGVDLDVKKGDFVAVLGHNGSGKSTLAKQINAILTPTDGTLDVDGMDVRDEKNIWDVRKTAGMVFQNPDNQIIGTVVEEDVGFGPENMGIPTEEIWERVEESLKCVGMWEYRKNSPNKLSGGQKQRVAIAGVVAMHPKCIVLDEPTSSLTVQEVNKLFEMMRMLKEQGIALIYISHKMDEIFEICDQVSVLRDGNLVMTKDSKDTNMGELITAMVGRSLESRFPPVDNIPGDTILSVQHLSTKYAPYLQDISFDVREGEIFGLYGLVGAGRTELLETIFGVRTRAAGRVYFRDHLMNFNNAREAIEHGFALITEERKANGLFLKSDLTFNTTIANLDQYKGGLGLSMPKMVKATNKEIKVMHTKCMGPDDMIASLSGGNQQKVILARWLATDPEFLILDEPTRGIDVGTKTEIQKLVIELADQGKSLIFISSEIEEMLRTCSKLVVLRDGQEVGEITEELTQGHVMQSIAGGGRNE